MKYIDEYRDKALIQDTLSSIHKLSYKKVQLMEVCGGHTMALHKFGIPALLPSTIKLLSGPGCPVCVTGIDFIDKAIELSKLPGTIIATYGDLIRVPGSVSSLDKEKAAGADVRIVLSPLDAVNMAKENLTSLIIFLAVGFETTTPGTAVAVLEAEKAGLENFFILCAHKIMPPAMEALVMDEKRINGFIAPGHVSTITGSGIYQNIAYRYQTPVVISGFEPLDLLQSILLLVKLIENKKSEVQIQYKRLVRPEGNPKALKLINEVFSLADETWRGIGVLPLSGLKLKESYKRYDVNTRFVLKISEYKEPSACICGDILKGVKRPEDCKLFGRKCSPENPVGACMVSHEGTCMAHYLYRKYE